MDAGLSCLRGSLFLRWRNETWCGLAVRGLLAGTGTFVSPGPAAVLPPYNPVMFPLLSTSSARGFPGSPGIVTMFPAIGYTNPAPVDARTSETSNV